MKNNIESEQPRLKVIRGESQLHSVGEKNGVHCLEQQRTTGEPISAVDFRLYQIALVQEAHVPAVDARKKVKELRDIYNAGDAPERRRIANVIISAFEGLTGTKMLLGEPVTIPREHVIYVKSR